MSQLSINLLGSFQVMRHSAAISAFESDKVRALLAYLALESGRPHRRGALAGLLWPDRPERAALLNLNQALANLRRALGDREAETPLILSTREAIQLNPAADLALDTATFGALLAACEAHTHRNRLTCAACARRLAEAAALYRGPFLEGFAPRDSVPFQEWALVVRERLERQALEALEWLAAYHERRQDNGAALQAAYRLVELDPWREEAHRQIMRLLWREGQRGAALEQYERCRRALEAELGIEPEQETAELYEQIRDAELSIENEELRNDPGASASQFSILNAQLTPFFGRAAELAQLAENLTNPACRLITVVGLGGSGKTRLALQVAAEQREAFADGARFVPLAALDDATLLLPAIAEALGLALGGAEDARDQLAAHLRDQELLLVLDNLEQLRGGVAPLAALLERAPGLTILATSRERLGLRGEWALDLGGLDLPSAATGAALETAAATALFLQAARRARADFDPAEAERQALARICRALGGHALGIELAAAWTPVLSCVEIEAELAGSLELLVSPAQDTPERHRTVRAVFDTSWRMLAPEQRRAMARLSAFRGGFDRAAAEAVCAETSLANEELRGDQPRSSSFFILPLLASLIGKSLLYRSAEGRYGMHELVRQYADEQLRRSGQAGQAWDSHTAYFLALLEQAEPHLKGADEATWTARLTAEHDNLRAALDRALARGQIEPAARMCVVLRWFWYVQGHLAEGRQWMERALAAADANPTALAPRLRARLLQGAGVLADEQADYAVAEARYQASIALYNELGDTKGVQATTNSLGMLAWTRGDYPQAQACFEASLRLSRQLDHAYGIANSLNGLGTAFQAQGDIAGAIARYEEALAAARALQYEPLITMILDNIGEVSLAQGDPDRAQAVYAEALARQRAQGDTRGAALSLQGLGLAAIARGDLAAAAPQIASSLEMSRHTASKRELASYLDNAAALLAAQGRAAGAARICAATDAFRERIGAPLAPFERLAYERTLAAARANLDGAAFGAAWAAGRAVGLDPLVDEVLDAIAPK